MLPVLQWSTQSSDSDLSFLETVGLSSICMFLCCHLSNTKIVDFVLGRESHAERILQYDGIEHYESCGIRSNRVTNNTRHAGSKHRNL